MHIAWTRPGRPSPDFSPRLRDKIWEWPHSVDTPQKTVQFADNEIVGGVCLLWWPPVSYALNVLPVLFALCVFCFLPCSPILSVLSSSFIGQRVPQGMYTFRGNASCRLTLLAGTFGTAFMGYRVHWGLYTILGKTSYTLIRLEGSTNCPFPFWIQFQEKPAIYTIITRLKKKKH